MRPFDDTVTPERRRPGPAEAGLIFSLLAVLQLYAGNLPFLTGLSDPLRILLSEALLIALPPLVFSALRRYPVVAAFRLRPPRLRDAALVLLIAPVATLTAFSAGLLAIVAVKALFGTLNIPGGVGDVLSRGMPVAVATIGLVPAVCEELMFRGFLQRGMEAFGARRAVVLSGLMFGLFHFDFQRLAAQMLLGLVIAYVVYRSGSLLNGMLLHFLHNAGSVLLTGLAAPMAARGGVAAAGFVWLAGSASGDVFASPLFLEYAERMGVSVDTLMGALAAGSGVLLVCGLLVLAGLMVWFRHVTRDVPHPPAAGTAPARTFLTAVPGLALILAVYAAIALGLAGHPAANDLVRLLGLG